MTATQVTVDGVAHGGKDLRAGRCASQNIIPSTTGTVPSNLLYARCFDS